MLHAPCSEPRESPMRPWLADATPSRPRPRCENRGDRVAAAGNTLSPFISPLLLTSASCGSEGHRACARPYSSRQVVNVVAYDSQTLKTGPPLALGPPVIGTFGRFHVLCIVLYLSRLYARPPAFASLPAVCCLLLAVNCGKNNHAGMLLASLKNNHHTPSPADAAPHITILWRNKRFLSAQANAPVLWSTIPAPVHFDKSRPRPHSQHGGSEQRTALKIVRDED